MKKKGLLISGLVLVALAAVVTYTNLTDAGASPCTNLGRCAWAAEAYCDQIEGTGASGARLVVTQRGNAGCEMCRDNGVCATVDCG